MKNKFGFRNIVILLVTLICSTSCFSCGDGDSAPSTNGGNGGSGNGGSGNSGSGNSVVVGSSDYTLLKYGSSMYKVLIPEDASQLEEDAADEMVYFFEKCTGVTLPICTDANFNDYSGLYLSIGQTKLLQQSGVTLDYNELGTDGYKIFNYNKSMIMAGAEDYGSLYSVYEYLKYQFDLEIYTKDIFSYEKTMNANLISLDLTDVPDIATRQGGIYITRNDSMAQYRYRMGRKAAGWGLYGHSQFTVLPPATYLAAHPSWYNDPTNPTQLSWTNEEMQQQFIANLKDIILESSENYFVLGQQDYETNGTGGNYDSVLNQYGAGKYASAVQIHFLNKVVREINQWAKTTIPDRADKLEFAMFAYNTTQEPPVIKSVNPDGTVKYSPICDENILEDNLGVMIAPIRSQVSYSYFDDTNETSQNIFLGWSVLAKKLYVWAYSANFWDFIVPHNSWGSVKENMQNYKAAGVAYLYEQITDGSTDTPVYNFAELRQYLVSKLAWNSSLNTDTLIRNFMKNFYGDGWQEIYEYYSIVRNRNVEFEEKGMVTSTGLYQYVSNSSIDYVNEKYYPKGFLDQCERLFDKAEEKATQTGDEAALFHIKKERLQVRYLMLELYASYFDVDTYLDMVDEFKEICDDAGIRFLSENDKGKRYSVATLVEKWASNVAA